MNKTNISRYAVVLITLCGFITLSYGKGEFKATVAISNDPHLGSKWNNTAGAYSPRAHTIDKVYRGETIWIRVFFENMALDENGVCDVTFDAKVLNPEWEEYFSADGVQAMNAKMASNEGLEPPVILTDVYAGYFASKHDNWGIIALNCQN